MFAVLSLGGGATTAGAQQIVVEKDLCGPAVPGGGCVIGGGGSMPLIAPYTAVSYQITLTCNDPGPTDVDLGETFPGGFVPTSTTCNTNLPTGAAPLFFGPVTVPGQGQITCLITGYFNYLPATANNANNEVTVYAIGDHERPIVVSNQVNASIASPATMPSDVSVVKEAMVIASGNGTTTVHYTITVTNNGPNDVYGLQLQDRVALPATSIPLSVSNLGNEVCTVVGSGGSDCFDAVPSTDNSPLTVPSVSPVDFVEWSYLTGAAGLLVSGDSIVVEFDVLIEVPVGVSCQLVEGGNELINEAHIGFNIPGATTTTFESAPGNNTSWVSVPVAYDGVVDPNCGQPALQISKTLAAGSPALFAWGDTVTYDITLTNSSNQTLANIQLFDAINGVLGDFVSGGIGTPAFTAEVVGIACAPAICSSTVPSTGPQSVTGYLNPHWMLGATISSLGAQSSVTFQVSILFSNPACDSYPDVTEKPVLNFVRGRYADPTLGGADVTLQTPPAIALFEAPAACDFRVTKSVNDGSDKIVFGQNVHYTVTYENLNVQPMTIGTMIDTLRLAHPSYAWPLTVHYDYLCSESGGVTGFPFGVGQSGVVQVVPTSLPQQGVRIIQNLTPVVFPGSSSVTCEVRVNVEVPVGAAQCGRLGALENAAIMDQSAFYNPNLPWGTTPGFYDTETLPLPQCIDLVVNKSADPLWTTQNGGPVNYQLVITNLGDPIVATDGVTVSDTFTPNVAVTPSIDSCLDPAFSSVPAPQVPSCDYAWSSPPPTNPSVLTIQTLDHNWSANPHFTSTAPYPAPPGQVCNNAIATLSGMSPEDWYARDPSTWETNRCVPIFDTKDLKVGKLLDVIAPATAPAATTFTVDVNCSWQFNGTSYGLTDTLTFAYPPNPIPPQGVQSIPINSTCIITEQQLPVGPFPDKRCPSGFAAWGVIAYPNAVGPDGTPQSVIVGNNSSNTLLVHNVYECVRDIVSETGSLFVGKDLVNNTGADLSGWIFPVTVECTGQPPVSLDLSAGQYSVIHNLPLGTDCDVTEDWQTIELPPAEKACPEGLVPQWLPASYEPASQTVSADPVAITVHNVIECVRPEKPADGTIEIIKKVTNNTAADLSGWTYPVVVSCDGGPEVFLNPMDGQSIGVDHIPFGVDCKVGEDTVALPVAERACPPPLLPQWTTSITPPADYFHAGDTATIHNVLDCIRPEKPVDGKIEVTKKVTNNTAADLSGWTYPVSVSCDGGPEVFLSLTDGQSLAVDHIPFGVDCKVGEDTIVLPPAERACPPPLLPQWTTSVTPTGYLHASDVATIHNVLDCVRPEKPVDGTITVRKKVTNNTTADLSGWTYPVFVSCDGGPEIFPILSDGQSLGVDHIPLSVDCKVGEDTIVLPPAERACPPPLLPQWTASVTPTGYLHAGDTATIHNVLDCVRPEKPVDGTITVIKNVTNNTSADLSGWTYPASVSCDGGPAVVLSLTDGQSLAVDHIPFGIDCKVVEDTIIVPVAERACPPPLVPQWTTSVTSVTPSDYFHAGDTATIHNILDCVGPEKPTETGTLTVWKYVANQTLFDVTPLQFTIDVDCGGSVTTMTLANGQSDTVTNLPLGTNCVVTETLPLPMPPGIGNECFTPSLVPEWTMPIGYYPGQSLQIAAATDAIYVLNTLTCVPGPDTSTETGDDGSLSIEKVCSEPVPAASGDGFEATCQITVIATGPLPATITISDQLNGPHNIPGYENQIVSMTSAENWSCPGMPVVAGIYATCQLAGTDLVAAGGQSVINVVVHFPDTGNASESQNCVEANGDDGTGIATSFASQVCAQFEGPGIAVCDPGMERRGTICVVPKLPKFPDFSIEITQPKQCERGEACTFVVELTNDNGDDYSGPLFLSSDLPASVGSDGKSISDWYCARSDMGGLCYIGLDSPSAEGLPSLRLPLMMPAKPSANPEACFMAGVPSSDMEMAVARATQLGLAANGFKLGTLDGVIGPKSKAAIATFAKRSKATIRDGEIDEVYRLIFGALPLSERIERREATCIALNLKPLPKRVTPPSPELSVDEEDQIKEDDQVDEEDKIRCVPPLELNRRGTACIPSQDLIELPGLEFPGSIVMPGF